MHDLLSPAGLIVTCYLTKIPANGRRSTVNSCAGGPSGPAANANSVRRHPHTLEGTPQDGNT